MLKRLSVVLIFMFGANAWAGDSHTDAAKRLMEVMQADAMIEQVYDQLMPAMQDFADQMGIAEDEREIFDAYMAKSIGIMRNEFSWEKMEPYMLEAYTSVYTEDEILDLVAFYESPTGQKFIAKMPELMQVSMQMSQRMMADMMPKLQKAQEELIAQLEAKRANQGG